MGYLFCDLSNIWSELVQYMKYNPQTGDLTSDTWSELTKYLIRKLYCTASIHTFMTLYCLYTYFCDIVLPHYIRFRHCTAFKYNFLALTNISDTVLPLCILLWHCKSSMHTFLKLYCLYTHFCDTVLPLYILLWHCTASVHTSQTL